MATKAEVRQRVGEDLGIVPIGQDLESQDQTRIDTGIDEAFALLKERGLAAWASTGEVPDKAVPHFCLLVEFMLLVSYSVPDSRYVRITSLAGADGELAVKKIAGVVVQEHESLDSATDY